MKKVYHMGDDLFIALGFMTFVLGGIFKLLGFDYIAWGITAKNLISVSMISLLFSIALSLYDLAHGKN